jgi:uncharacterized protein YqhQ
MKKTGDTMKKPSFNVGGEAVIEGVMMRSPHFYAIAVRRTNKKLTVTADPVKSASFKYKFWKWPIFRGILGMWESMALGMRALTYSANIMEEDMAKEDAKKGKAPAKPRNETLDNTISFSIAILLAVGLFILLPYGINRLIAKQFTEMNTNRVWFNTGMIVFKFSIFFLYVWGISFMSDVKRLFQYHGAEHKTIYAFEAGKKMSVTAVKPYSTRHPRCGTAFIIVTVLISLILFVLFLPAELKWWQRILYEIPLIIPIVGISYELLKLSDKFRDNPLMKIFIAPGLAFQRLTTREPDKGQMEAAVKALKTVVALENAWIKKYGKKQEKMK